MNSNHLSARFAATVMGTVAFLALLPASAPAQVLKRTFTGAAGEHVSVVANVGDVNADGYPDVAVGAPDAKGGGRVDVYSGLDGAILHTIVPADLGRSSQFNAIGFAIAGNLDWDGDGFGDLVLGDPRNIFTEGIPVYGYGIVFSLRTRAVLRHAASGHHSSVDLGYAVATLPDWEGDGRNEVAVGAPGMERVYISFSSKRLRPDESIDGPQPGSRFGQSLATMASDLDGDGSDDLAVGAPLFDDKVYNNAGMVSIYSSADLSHHADLANTVAPSAQFGFSLASLGDSDGDDYADFAIGSPQFDDPITGFANAGRVQVFSNLNLLPGTLVGGTPDSQVGYAVANVGDQNLDGIADLAIADLNLDPAHYGGEGTAQTISGADHGLGHYSTVLYVHALSAGSGGTDRNYGATLAGGDFDRDGMTEMLVGDYDWHTETGNGLVDWWEAAPARIIDFGTAWPGELGYPTMKFPLPPGVGEQFDISIYSSSSSDQIALLLLGVEPDKFQLKSGAVLLVKPITSLLFNLSSKGETLSFDIEQDPSLYGLSVYAQMVMTDKFAKGNLSFSSGSQIQLGYIYP